jgi:hypothetical protein
MAKYRNIYQCPQCGTKWKGPVYTAMPGMTAVEDAETRPIPNCPNLDCGIAQIPRGMDMSSNRAPATIGANISVKAIDETAKIVMQDYGMTDLRTDVREHETASPKLAPVLQAQADNFFVGRGRRQQVGVRDPKTGNVVPMKSSPAAMGAAAISGAFRQPAGRNPIENMHAAADAVQRETAPRVVAAHDPRK